MKSSKLQMSLDDLLNEPEALEKGVSIKVKANDQDIDVMRPLIVARKQAKLTQKDLADKVNMDQGDISKLERGLRNPTVHLLQRLADAMNLEVEIKYVKKQD